MNSNSILPDTSLCAIVRDEIDNPAWGVRDFVESTVPHVEQAVILDTGSIDETWKELQRLQKIFPNLHVFQHPFEGYAESRNRALAQVKTKRALVLDADERIKAGEFSKLREFLAINGHKKGYNLDEKDVFESGKEYPTYAHRCRLFNVRGVKFINERDWRFEKLNLSVPLDYIPGITIWQFVLNSASTNAKSRDWYALGDEIVKSKGVQALHSPSQCPSFKSWKQRNPHREAYR